MTSALEPLLDAVAGCRALVVGEAMLDAYLDGAVHRLSQEAPVPVVALERRQDAPGGAANAAVNARALGAEVSLLSVTGDDDAAERLAALLDGHGVERTGLVREGSRRTHTKRRIVAAGQMLLRLDEGSSEPLSEESEAALVAALRERWASAEAVVVSDYAHGVITPAVIQALCALQARAPRVLVVDARHPIAYRNAGVTACKPNFGEVAALLDLEEGDDRAAAVTAHGRRLLDLCGAQVVAVTLDTEGALVFERGRPPYRTFARPQPGSRAAGAGDTFTVALALGLAAGGDVPAAAELASAAAGVVVDQAVTAACSAEELRRRLGGSGKIVPSLADLRARRDSLRADGRRVVLTSGCFDLLHRGHVTYLNRAKELGDLLVVAVNDDAGVRRLKGDGRPISPLEDRLGVLAGLSSVDVVVPFGEDTPVEVVRSLSPDVFVKGGDYTRESLPEGAEVERLGGTVRIVPYVDDRSTSALIERIRAQAG